MLQRVLMTLLTSVGHKVSLCSDGTEALATLESEKPDAVLTDIRMWPMDGLQFLQLFKAKHADVPVIIMTAHASAEMVEKAKAAGVFDFVTKPIRFQRLQHTLDRALKVAASASPKAAE